uniref:Uncharacterized protein n=1 Tax=Arundo donax TaxID=35708 RepID=A0A0A9AFJ7_ARUDO
MTSITHTMDRKQFYHMRDYYYLKDLQAILHFCNKFQIIQELIKNNMSLNCQ